MEFGPPIYDKKNCELCSKPFGPTRMKHGCKRCKLIICSDCTKTSSIVIGYLDEPLLVPHKICAVCQNEEEFQKQFRIKENASWNTLSSVGNSWIQRSEVIDYLTSQNLDYNYYLSLAKDKGLNNPSIIEIDKEVKRGRYDKESFNYPMLELLHYLQLNTSQDSARSSVANILKAFVMKNEYVAYQYGLGNLVIFLLCFLDEPNAFTMLNYIIDVILPKGFYEKDPTTHLYGYQIENYLIYRLASDAWKLTKIEDSQTLLIFFEEIALPMLQSLLIDFANFENLFFIWNRVIENKNFYELEKFILASLDYSKNKIFDKSEILTLTKYQMHLCRYLPQIMVEKHMNGVPDEILESKVDEAFIQNCSLTLIRVQNDYYNAFDQFSTFNNDEIKAILDNIQGYIQNLKKGKFKADITDKIIMDRIELVALVEEVLPKNKEKKITTETIEKFFYFIDNDKTRKFTLTHFIDTIVLINGGSLDEKIDFLIRFYDSNDKKYLDVKEAKKLIIGICEALYSMKRLLPNLFLSRDLFSLRYKIHKTTKKLEMLTKANLELEKHLLLDFSHYFEQLSKVKSLIIVPTTNYINDEDEDGEGMLGIPEPDYQRRATSFDQEHLYKYDYGDYDSMDYGERNIEEERTTPSMEQGSNGKDGESTSTQNDIRNSQNTISSNTGFNGPNVNNQSRDSILITSINPKIIPNNTREIPVEKGDTCKVCVIF